MSLKSDDPLNPIAISLPEADLASFCRRHHIRELALFGSVVTGGFGPESDIDMLVEFAPHAEVDLFEFSGMRLELMEIFGRKVDLVTPSSLKPLIKDSILANKVVIYAV